MNVPTLLAAGKLLYEEYIPTAHLIYPFSISHHAHYFRGLQYNDPKII